MESKSERQARLGKRRIMGAVPRPAVSVIVGDGCTVLALLSVEDEIQLAA